MNISKKAWAREEQREKERKRLLEEFDKLIPTPTPAEHEINGRLIDIQDAAFDRTAATSKQHRHTTYYSLGAAAMAGFVIPLADMADNRLTMEEGLRYIVGPGLSLFIVVSIMIKIHLVEKERQRKEQADLKDQQQAVNP